MHARTQAHTHAHTHIHPHTHTHTHTRTHNKVLCTKNTTHTAYRGCVPLCPAGRHDALDSDDEDDVPAASAAATRRPRSKRSTDKKAGKVGRMGDASQSCRRRLFSFGGCCVDHTLGLSEADAPSPLGERCMGMFLSIHQSDCLPPSLPACLPAYLSACLPASLPADLRPCLPACRQLNTPCASLPPPPLLPNSAVWSVGGCSFQDAPLPDGSLPEGSSAALTAVGESVMEAMTSGIEADLQVRGRGEEGGREED